MTFVNTETFPHIQKFDVINVVNIRAASGVNLQKLIARGVVLKNLTAAAQIYTDFAAATVYFFTRSSTSNDDSSSRNASVSSVKPAR